MKLQLFILWLGLSFYSSLHASQECTQQLLVLDCFKPYKTGLTETHYKQLRSIRRLLQLRLEMKHPVTKIVIQGHAARYKSSDPTAENALLRAHEVEQELKDNLIETGYPINTIAFTVEGLSDSSPLGSNQSQAGRALNRRVELALISPDLNHKGPMPKKVMANVPYAPCTSVQPYPDVDWLTDPQLNKIRRGRLSIDPLLSQFNLKPNARGLINGFLAKWSCRKFRWNLLHYKGTSQGFDPQQVSGPLLHGALNSFQKYYNLSDETKVVLEKSTLEKMDNLLGLPLLSTGFMSLASTGFYLDPDTLVRFFNGAYDVNKHKQASIAYLKQLNADTTPNKKRMQRYFDPQEKKVISYAKYLGIRMGSPLPKSVRSSLQIMAAMESPQKFLLAPSFVIGFREAWQNLLKKTKLKDTWGSSGLDFLHQNQGKLRKAGYLPRGLRFAKGQRYDEVSPETGKKIKSASVPGKYILLAHSGYISYAWHSFKLKAIKRGFSKQEIESLSVLSKSYWLAQTFARPGGAPYKKWQKYKPEKKLQVFGINTLLDYFRDHNLRLEQTDKISRLKEFNRFKTVNIALRTAPVIAGLNQQMASYAHQRHLELSTEYLSILGSSY